MTVPGVGKQQHPNSDMAARRLCRFMLRGVGQGTVFLPEFRLPASFSAFQSRGSFQRSIAAAARTARASQTVQPIEGAECAMPLSALQEWQAITGVDGGRLTSKKAKTFFADVCWTHVSGWPQHLVPPRGYDTTVRYKQKYPEALIGHRCKESQSLDFIGGDAVIVSELLNGKLGIGNEERGTRKGCPIYTVPKSKIEAAVAELCTNNQLEVLLVEHLQEAMDAPIVQICTPHQPLVRMGLSNSGLQPDGEALAAGMQWSRSGWTMTIWNLATRTKWTRHGLNTELLQDQLQALNVSPPIYVLDVSGHGHVQRDVIRLAAALKKLFFAGDVAGRVAVRQVHCDPGLFHATIEQKLDATHTEPSAGHPLSSMPMEWASIDQERSAAAVTCMCDKAAASAPMLSSAGCEVAEAEACMWRAGPNVDRLVLHSTAFNLGLVDGGVSNVPSLLNAVTEGAASLDNMAAPKKRIAALLLNPPEPDIAKLVQQAIRQCWDLNIRQEWKAVSRPVALKRFLKFGPTAGSGCAEAALLADLLQVAKCTRAALQSPSAPMQQLAESVLQIATSSRGVNRPLSTDSFLRSCERLEEVLEAVVVDSSSPLRGNSDWELEKQRVQAEIHLQSQSPKAAMTDSELGTMECFFRNYEESTITDIFNKDALPGSLRARLSQAMTALVDATCEFFKPDHSYISLVDRNATLKFHQSAECMSLYSSRMSTSILKKWSSGAVPASPGCGEVVPFDADVANSRIRQKCFTTSLIRDAQEAYIAAHQEAMETFEGELRRIWEQITGPNTSMPFLLTIMIAREFAEWGRLITAVAEVAYQKKWSLPTLSDGGTALRLEAMWPYWLPGEEGGVKNDIVLEDSMAVLSGPNMGGKSTALRSITAAVLLGNAGLPIPTAPGSQVPQYRSFICRSFHGDSPLEHRSGFALEAHEMGVLLGGLGEPRAHAAGKPRAFVCIDEFGKGTEDKQATALCAASLRHLDEVHSPQPCTATEPLEVLQRAYNGVFATHQHALFDVGHGLFQGADGAGGQLQHTETWCIEAGQNSDREDASTSEADFLIVPGVNTNSLAFQVAAREGISDEVINLAKLWRDRLDERVQAPKRVLQQSLQHAQAGLLNGDDQKTAATPTSDPSATGHGAASAYQLNADTPQSRTTAAASCTLSPSRKGNLQTHQVNELPSSLLSIGKSIPAPLAATSSIPVSPGVQGAPHEEKGQPLLSVVPHDHAPENGSAVPQSEQRSFGWGGQSSAQQPEAWSTLSASTSSSATQVQNCDQLQSAATWQSDLQAVKEIVEAEIHRVCDSRQMLCIQLHIAGGESPGVQYMDYSCVYVIQVVRPSQPLAYYVGESDNVRQRLRTHSKTAPKRFQGAVNAAVVAGLKKGEKSSAKKAESSIIKSLQAQGYFLLSTSDMRNKSFGSARG